MGHEPDKNANAAHGHAAAAAGGGGLLSKLLPAVIVIAVVSGEGAAAYMLLPSAADSAAAARAALEAHAPEPEDDHHSKEPELEEVDLEQFKITSFQPASSITLRIEFRLYGMVKADKAEEFRTLAASKKNRLRDNVMSIIRSADMNDLTDPALGLIKRKILETTNKALGKPLLQGVVFAEFTFLEQ